MKAGKTRRSNSGGAHRKLPVAAVLVAVLALSGAAGVSSQGADNASISSNTSSESAQSHDKGVSTQDDTSSEADTSKDDSSSSDNRETLPSDNAKQKATSASYKAHTWSYEKYPLYYKVWGKAKTSSINKGTIETTTLDSLGRTRAITAKVTYKMLERSRGTREDMSGLTCSGWGNQAKVTVSLSNGRTYSGYGWNRSHLLADSLGGHAVEENVVCGTRTQNVGNNTADAPGGMAYTETLARDYLGSHETGWVYYKATPVYKGSELVPRSVYVDIRSDDNSIDQHVEVFNAMRGYKIDYETGTLASTSASVAKAREASAATQEPKYVYVTRSGKKYHQLGCRYLNNSKTKMSLSAAKSAGFTACSVCF